MRFVSILLKDRQRSHTHENSPEPFAASLWQCLHRISAILVELVFWERIATRIHRFL